MMLNVNSKTAIIASILFSVLASSAYAVGTENNPFKPAQSSSDANSANPAFFAGNAGIPISGNSLTTPPSGFPVPPNRTARQAIPPSQDEVRNQKLRDLVNETGEVITVDEKLIGTQDGLDAQEKRDKSVRLFINGKVLVKSKGFYNIVDLSK